MLTLNKVKKKRGKKKMNKLESIKEGEQSSHNWATFKYTVVVRKMVGRIIEIMNKEKRTNQIKKS